jgi:hypothetical protein
MSRGAHADERPAGTGLRLFITGLGIGQICSWGSVYYSFPLIAEAMGRELGWSKPDLYGAATIGLLLSGLAAYPVGSAIDRGHGRTIMAGAVFIPPCPSVVAATVGTPRMTSCANCSSSRRSLLHCNSEVVSDP